MNVHDNVGQHSNWWGVLDQQDVCLGVDSAVEEDLGTPSVQLRGRQAHQANVLCSFFAAISTGPDFVLLVIF